MSKRETTPDLDCDSITRSELARAAGIGLETVRFYESKGLLMPAFRDSANYRRYDSESLRRARIIKSAKELGFTLEEIGELLDLRDYESNPCAQARGRARAKLETIDRKLKELKALRAELSKLIDACAAKESEGRCSILEALEK